jgi:hypothetical protein
MSIKLGFLSKFSWMFVEYVKEKIQKKKENCLALILEL